MVGIAGFDVAEVSVVVAVVIAVAAAEDEAAVVEWLGLGSGHLVVDRSHYERLRVLAVRYQGLYLDGEAAQVGLNGVVPYHSDGVDCDFALMAARLNFHDRWDHWHSHRSDRPESNSEKIGLVD